MSMLRCDEVYCTSGIIYSWTKAHYTSWKCFSGVCGGCTANIQLATSQTGDSATWLWVTVFKQERKTAWVNENTSVHITFVKRVNLFLLGKCTVYAIMSATETSQGEVFLPEKISKRGSFEFWLTDLSGKHM